MILFNIATSVTQLVKNSLLFINEEEEPTRCYLVFYYTYNRLNMFRAEICPSSGAHDYISDYHVALLILKLLMVGGPCGNQRYSRKLLMMGIVLPETC
jgi:hypothetical protein